LTYGTINRIFITIKFKGGFMVFDPVNIINIILCTFIVILGLIGMKRMNNPIPMFIAIAFALFGVSHVLTLFGLEKTLEVFLIIIRTLAYLIVVYAMFHSVKK